MERGLWEGAWGMMWEGVCFVISSGFPAESCRAESLDL